MSAKWFQFKGIHEWVSAYERFWDVKLAALHGYLGG